MGFDIPGFVSGLSAVLGAFFIAWVAGLIARVFDYSGE